MKKFFYCVLLFCICSCASAGENPHEDASKLFSEAMLLRAETGRSADDSAALFSRSADLFETAAREDWRFWFESGNSRWWAGDGAGAIVAYRRYIARNPFNSRVWHNLGSARTLAGTIPPANEGLSGWPWPLALAALAAFLSGAALLLFSVYLFFRKSAFRSASAAVFSCAAAAALSCAGAVLLSRPAAVILSETQGRMGDSGLYAPVPVEPLKRGQEVLVLGSRDTWSRVRVGPAECWVPTASLEVVK